MLPAKYLWISELSRLSGIGVARLRKAMLELGFPESALRHTPLSPEDVQKILRQVHSTPPRRGRRRRAT